MFEHELLYVLLTSGNSAVFAVGLDAETAGRSILKKKLWLLGVSEKKE